MTAATPRTTPRQILKLYFISKFCNCQDLFSVPIGFTTCSSSKICNASVQNENTKNLTTVVRVLQKTEDGKEMYKDL